MSLWENPFFAFGMFFIMFATAVAFPEITLEWIEFSEEGVTPFMKDVFKTGIVFLAIGFLSLPIWIALTGEE